MKTSFDVVLDREIAGGSRIKASHLPDWMLAHGVIAATTDEIAMLLGTTPYMVRHYLAPIRKRGAIVSIYRSLWVAVPPEYRTWGAPPAIEVVDILMRYFDAQYYVGWLSAAALLGASHHAPQVFQVAASVTMRDRQIGRSKMLFFKRKNIDKLPTFTTNTRNGAVPVSNRAVTLLDVASDLPIVGGLNNAANLIVELCDTDEPFLDEIIELSPLYSTAAARRLGWIMANFTEVQRLDALALAIKQKVSDVSRLDPSKPKSGTHDKMWRIDVNTSIEVDL